MSAGKVIGYIFSGILIIFGVLFVLATFSPEGQIGWLIIGVILVGIGFAIILVIGRSKPGSVESGASNISLNIDLPGDVNLDTMKCQSCGGALSMENIKMVAGAPVVSCPFCNTTYQLTEEPKW
jgi:hypothetical protein